MDRHTMTATLSSFYYFFDIILPSFIMGDMPDLNSSICVSCYICVLRYTYVGIPCYHIINKDPYTHELTSIYNTLHHSHLSNKEKVQWTEQITVQTPVTNNQIFFLKISEDSIVHTDLSKHNNLQTLDSSSAVPELVSHLNIIHVITPE